MRGLAWASLRLAACAALPILGPEGAQAQAALTSDLWRVAAGTLAEPAALASDGAAALWTPAVILPAPTVSLRVGIEAIHTPSEVGVNGGIAAVAMRAPLVGTLNFLYGRIGLSDLVRTETSPEAVGGSIPAYAQVVSAGVARTVAPGLVAGAAARLLSGRLGDRAKTQWGVDLGFRYAGIRGVLLGATTRFFDPTLGEAEGASSYDFGAELRSEEFPIWGTTGWLRFRYGASLAHGEEPQQLFSAGMALGGTLEMDLAMVHEEAGDDAVWRARADLTVTAGRFRVQGARDAGVNGFGATYRIGLVASFP